MLEMSIFNYRFKSVDPHLANNFLQQADNRMRSHDLRQHFYDITSLLQVFKTFNP